MKVSPLWSRVNRLHGYHTDLCTNVLMRYFDIEIGLTYTLCITTEQPDQRMRDRRYIEAMLDADEQHGRIDRAYNPLRLRYANNTYWVRIPTSPEIDEWLESRFRSSTVYYVWLEFTDASWKQFKQTAWKCRCCYTLNCRRNKKCIKCGGHRERVRPIK